MARAFFICEMIIHPTSKIAYPAIEDVRNVDNFPCVWIPTRYQDLRRTAIGIAEVTPAQLALLQVDPKIEVIDLPDDWENHVPEKTKSVEFLNRRGFVADKIAANMSVKQMVKTLADDIRPNERLDSKHLKDNLFGLFGVQ